MTKSACQEYLKSNTPKAFELAKNVGYLYACEMVAMSKIVANLDKPKIVNIGAGAGTSCLLFLESNKDSYVTTIDIRDGDTPLGSLLGERNALKDAGYWDTDRVCQIHGDSKEAHHHLSDYNFDFIFVDGDHLYESCLSDMKLYFPKLKYGGHMAVHDYEHGNWGHVVSAVDYFVEEYNKYIGDITIVDTTYIFQKEKIK